MAEGRFERNLLERLNKGEDCAWIFIPDKVSKGKITRDEALTSLKTCLEIVIPQYKENLKKAEEDLYGQNAREHWPKRIEEAEEALKSINNGSREIVYREVRLN